MEKVIHSFLPTHSAAGTRQTPRQQKPTLGRLFFWWDVVDLNRQPAD